MILREHLGSYNESMEQFTNQLFSTCIDPRHNEAAQRWHPYAVDPSDYASPAGDERYDWAGWGLPRLLRP